MPNFILREPLPADFPSWKSLFEGYNAFYGREGPTALAPAVIETTWKRIHDPAEPVHALVAEQDLFTVPEARGRGVARALIEAVYERARKAGASRVYWQTHESNTTAQRLYDRIAERSGFIVYRHQLA